MTSHYETEICIPYRGVDQDIPIRVHYEAVPFCAGSTDGKHGPRLEPDIPAHIEIERCEVIADGHEIELTSKQEAAIEELIAQHLADEAFSD